MGFIRAGGGLRAAARQFGCARGTASRWVARGASELDQLDVVEGLHLRGTGPVEALTGISLWEKRALASPSDSG